MLREFKDKLFHRDLARSMVNEPRAPIEEIIAVSTLLNEAQRSILPPWETPSWFKLFRQVDADGSGLISYAEFVDMVHDVLRLHLPEPRLKALWLALDTDCSGYLTSGEFGAFMRLGDQPVDRAVVAKRSVAERNRLAGIAVREEKDRLFHRDVARSMVHEPRARADENTPALYQRAGMLQHHTFYRLVQRRSR